MKSMQAFVSTLAILATTSLLTGCGDQTDAPAKNAPVTDTAPDATVEPDSHAHGDAPHGGTITDWGGGAYHVEFTVDHDTKEATVYILASDAKTAAPIKTDMIRLVINDPATEMDLVASPLEGEADGTSSRFVGTHDNIGTVQEFAGTISGEVEGTPYVGEFKELAGAHGHDH